MRSKARKNKTLAKKSTIKKSVSKTSKNKTSSHVLPIVLGGAGCVALGYGISAYLNSEK